LRGYFADRYDARSNLVDWDYHMRLKAVASIIHVVHYKKWRLTGIAYEERLCTYTHPNRTFASYREAKSKSRGGVSVRGYWSDTLASPYLALGVDADDSRLFARRNHQHVKTSPHVAEYNLLQMLYELETGAKYVLPGKEKAAREREAKRKKAAAAAAKGEKPAPPGQDEEPIVELPEDVPLPVLEPAPAVASASSSSPSSSSLPAALSHSTPNALSLAHVRFVFLNGSVEALAPKSRYSAAFDGAYLSQFQVGVINPAAAQRAAQEVKAAQSTPDAAASTTAAASPASSSSSSSSDPLPLNTLLRPAARVSVETVKFLPVSLEVKHAYAARVRELATSAGWAPSSPTPATAWSSPDAAHSWTDRDVEQQAEEADKKQALTEPAHLHFVVQAARPASAATGKAP